MAKSQVYKRSTGGSVTFNMTPMIDVTFQLILFFILAGQMASAELASLILHEPEQSVATEDEALMKGSKVVVNVTSVGTSDPEKADLAEGGQAKAYKVRGRTLPLGPGARGDSVRALRDILKEARAGAPNPDAFAVEVRADYRVRFEYIWPVLRLAADVGIPDLNITALLERE